MCGTRCNCFWNEESRLLDRFEELSCFRIRGQAVQATQLTLPEEYNIQQHGHKNLICRTVKIFGIVKHLFLWAKFRLLLTFRFVDDN
jgi:hypothetical protein